MTPRKPRDADEMPPGAAGYVQFFLREPLALKPGDRLVIRSFSPSFTWGGGVVLHVNPALKTKGLAVKAQNPLRSRRRRVPERPAGGPPARPGAAD